MKVNFVAIFVLTFNIFQISELRILKNYQNYGLSKSTRNFGLDLVQDEMDADRLLHQIEDGLAVMNAQNMLFELQNRKLNEIRGLSITNNLEVLQERLINMIGKKRVRQV